MVTLYDFHEDVDDGAPASHAHEVGVDDVFFLDLVLGSRDEVRTRLMEVAAGKLLRLAGIAFRQRI
jgi:hypothetical protein